jgi:uncharacterized membrane protein
VAENAAATAATFVQRTVIRGAIVLVPVAVLALLAQKLVEITVGVLAPVSGQLPANLQHPQVIAAVLLVVLCFCLGILVRTRLGRRAYGRMEESVFNKIPGYQPVRALAQKMAGESDSEEFSVALVELEDALVPAFIVERHADERYTVLVPSVPTPLAGALYILPAKRVHHVDVPFRKAMACFTHWGAGTGALLESYHAGGKQVARGQKDTTPTPVAGN